MALLMTFKVIQQNLSDNHINQYWNLEKAPFTLYRSTRIISDLQRSTIICILCNQLFVTFVMVNKANFYEHSANEQETPPIK